MLHTVCSEHNTHFICVPTNAFSSKMRYQYAPLQEQDHIRVLKLNPASDFGDDIHIELHEISLNPGNGVAYEAFSYVWGLTTYLSELTVGPSGGETLAITQNLDSALRHLRRPDVSRTLWVDAICIDQNNLPERSEQVAIMGDIYRFASCVIVWLGPAENDSDCAMDTLHESSRLIEVDWTRYTMCLSAAAPTNSDLASISTAPPWNVAQWAAIFHLIQRPYFERLWIRQEVRLGSSNAVVHCGFSSMTWRAFRDAVFFIYRKPGFVPVADDRARFNLRMLLVYTVCDDNQAVGFSELRHQFQLAQCNDPHDRIYAVLSLLDPADQNLGIVPNYSMPTEQVYRDVAVRILEQQRSLYFLRSCSVPTGPDALVIPSWVPDWSTGGLPALFTGQKACGPFLAHAQVSSNILTAAGVHVSMVVGVQGMTTSNILSLSRLCWNLIPGEDLDAPYVAGGSTFDALCRTLLCGALADSIFPPVPSFPTIEDVKRALRPYLQNEKSIPPTVPPCPTLSMTSREVIRLFNKRAFFVTIDGHVGLGPKDIQTSDAIAVVLGCDSVLALRPTGASQFRVIGECYVGGLMAGEAVLGRLLNGMRQVAYYNERLGNNYAGFLDGHTGTVQGEDPRLHSLPLDLDKLFAGVNRDAASVYVEPDILRKAGRDIRLFDLV